MRTTAGTAGAGLGFGHFDGRFHVGQLCLGGGEDDLLLVLYW